LPLANRTKAEFEAVDLVPFQNAVRSGADAIMTAHVIHPSLDSSAPATLSPRILQGLLREKLGYQGLIVSDSLLMRALTSKASLNEVTVAAFKAGVDVLAIGADAGYTRLDQRNTYQAVLDAVNADSVLRLRLDESVRRILLAKARYGVLDRQPADADRAAVVLGSAEHRRVAEQIARASVTLVRDADRLVPLQANAKVLLVLPSNAKDLGRPLKACHDALTIVRVPQNATARDVAAMTRRAEDFDGVVLATMNTALFPGQALLVKGLNVKPVIIVALQSPYDLLSFPEAKTYLTAYSDVPASLQALADVLCGNATARGKLPVELVLRP
jgi:beta-N-acetylhexosaminidase